MISINKKDLNKIFEHVKKEYPKEACGILSGKENKITKVYNMKNTSENPETCYFMDSKEQFKVFKEIRDENLEMIAIYHSHTNTEAYPSKKDIEMAFYADAYYAIISFADYNNPVIRTFKIIDGKIVEENIKIEE